MPLPHPGKDESREDFLARCMGTDVMVSDFPKEDQRYAVCVRQWSGGKLSHEDMKDRKTK
jgi:hypothetical protein